MFNGLYLNIESCLRLHEEQKHRDVVSKKQLVKRWWLLTSTDQQIWHFFFSSYVSVIYRLYTDSEK